jgi:hypothetical protein
MPLPFDATLKDVVRRHPADYGAAFGLPVGVPTTVLNVDLSTLSAATDVALGYGDPLAEVVDLNFQSGPDAALAARLLLYRAAVHLRYRVPVRSVLVLLRPAANHSHLTGELRFGAGVNRVESWYEVIRLWELPAERLLTGGLGVLPLAPLGQLSEGVAVEDGLAQVVGRINDRLRAEASHAEASVLMTAAYVLTGLRVQQPNLDRIYQGVGVMEDSAGYLTILERGGIKTLRGVLLRLGRRRFGEPDAATATALAAITDLDRLERMAEAVLTAADWPELLATP